MSEEIALAAEAVPIAAAGIGTYGKAVLAKAWDDTAHPDDNDIVAQFRLTIRRALEADPTLDAT